MNALNVVDIAGLANPFVILECLKQNGLTRVGVRDTFGCKKCRLRQMLH